MQEIQKNEPIEPKNKNQKLTTGEIKVLRAAFASMPKELTTREAFHRYYAEKTGLSIFEIYQAIEKLTKRKILEYKANIPQEDFYDLFRLLTKDAREYLEQKMLESEGGYQP